MGDAPAALLAPLERFGVKLGLEAMREILADLGDPQRRRGQILIAGTNGKGSTAVVVASILEAAGVSTGLYTSPHLEAVEERIRQNGRPIESEELSDALRAILRAAQRRLGHPPTYFEALTAAAFSLFAGSQVEAQVIEVGLGGRLDATNCAEPEISVVTSISRDHMMELGEAAGAIAREKAGIFRPGRPALWWGGSAEADGALSAASTAVGAELERVGSGVEVEIEATDWTGWRGRLTTPRATYALRSPLAGAHQVGNVALAVRTAERFAELRGLDLPAAVVEAGVAGARWPGRLESVEMPDGRRVLLDAAHNAAGARSLAAFLARRGAPFALLFGALRDKEAARMLLELSAARAVVAVSPTSPRALDSSELETLAGPGSVAPSVAAGLDRLLERPEPVLVVAGSIYLVGEARALLRRRVGAPESTLTLPVVAGRAPRR